MAKTTFAIVHQDVQLENKGIEINVWEKGVKGGRLLITKATVLWFAPHAKKPTWTGTWEDLAKVLSNAVARCDHCGITNTVRRDAHWHTCDHCGKRFHIEW
jgi:hypothetical protein